MRLFYFSSYTDEAREYLQDSFQKTFFQVTDGAVALRELTKIGLIVASTLSSFSPDPSNLKYTIMIGVSWSVLSFASNKLEHIAKKNIAILKEDRQSIIGPTPTFQLRLRAPDTSTTMSPEEARDLGLL